MKHIASFILTLVLIALIIDIGLDSYWHGVSIRQFCSHNDIN